MHYAVSTPQYESVEPILDDGTGPIEVGCDIVCVEANTKREAIIKGVKIMRSKEYMPGWKTYYDWYWDESTNPFTGVKAEPLVCKHGFCNCWNIPCDISSDDYCLKCDEEYQDTCEHSWWEIVVEGPLVECRKCGLGKEEYDRRQLI